MAPSSPTRPRPRSGSGGFTLLEILVVSAIAAILVVTAASLLVTMSSQRAANRKRLERLTQSFTAMTLLERSMLNAGYHFPSARFGFRVYDNVTTGSFGGLPVGACTNANGCIVANTDVLEVVEGAVPQPGIIGSVFNDGGTSWIVAHQQPGGPIFLADAGTSDFLLLFGAPDGGNCAGIGKLANLGGPIGLYNNVRMVDRNLGTQPNTYYSTGNGIAARAYNCPTSVDMTVSVAISRRLYLVLATDAGFGLYEQSVSPLSIGSSAGDGGTPQLLARGVDNFQVMPLIRQTGTGFGTGCANGVCECNSGSSCVLSTANDDTNFANLGRLVGVRVGLSSRGETTEFATGANVVPPALGNETMAAEVKPIKRTVQTQTYMLRNFAQVSP